MSIEMSTTTFGPAPRWMTLLGATEQGGRDYAPEVEGTLPAELRGALYRNGPGRFERGGYRIKHLLDGDGLIQRLSFSDAGVRYQNAFVRTEKLVAEEAANKRLQATWTTRKSDAWWDNLGGAIGGSQAGITIYPIHRRLLARDEYGPSYAINPETLETIEHMPPADMNVGYKAHSRIDPETGEWIVAGAKYGRTMHLHAEIYDRDFKLKRQISHESPRSVYFHDFLATKRYVVFVLHPCMVSPFGFLLGLKSFTESLTWRPEAGSIIALVPRDGSAARYVEAPASYMWHGLNAFDDGEDVVIDFVGFDEPDHFIGRDAFFSNIMQGRMGHAQAHGKMRRYRIGAGQTTAAEEIIDNSNHEFPMLHWRGAMARPRIGYFTCGGLGVFNTGVKRFDFETGQTRAFDFGAEAHVGEPVFAEKRGGADGEGWLITQCLDGRSERSFFAVFDAAAPDVGPVAKIWLTHAAPISFHGAWLG
jgi:all-trans-8'-apo-beta-carotenal 15,15'-oxygenase